MTDSKVTRSEQGAAPVQATNGDIVDLAVLWKRKWLLLFLTALSAGLGAAYSHHATPIFEAKARVHVQDTGLIKPELRARNDAYFMATQAEIIRSPVTIERALKVTGSSNLSENSAEAIDRVLRSLSVSPLDDTNVLQIGIRGVVSEDATRLLTAVIESYSDYVRETELSQNAGSLSLLARQEEKLRTDLEKLRNEFYSMREESPLIGQASEATEMHMSRLRHIGARLAATQNRRIDYESSLKVAATEKTRRENEIADAQINEIASATRSDIPFPIEHIAFKPTDVEVADAPETVPFGAVAAAPSADPTLVENYLWQAQSREKQMRQEFGPKHPEVVALQKQISWWEQQLNESRDTATVANEMQVEALKIAEQDLTTLYDEELRTTKELDRYLLRQTELLDSIGRVEQIHQEKLSALMEAEVAGQALRDGQSSISVRMIETPQVSADPVWPQPVQLIGLCAVMGLLGGCVLVSLTERMRSGPARAAA